MLTQKLLLKLPRPEKGNKLYFDGEIPGFAVRITAGGVISFVLQYRIHQRERRFTIEQHPFMSVAEARDEALRLRSEISKGRDPLDNRRSDREAPTMKDLADDYFERHADGNKRASSLRNDHQMLDNVILPKLGNRQVAAVTRRDLESLHASLRETPYRANRILALLSTMFSFAVQWHKEGAAWRPDNPADGIKHFPEEKRERWLEDEELSRLTAALNQYPNQDAANAIRLLVLTGARKMEVLSATWWQFDLKRGTWTKPSAHTKQKKIHHVPLSEEALELLTKMKAKSQGGAQDYLFPGRSEGAHLHDLKNDWKAICKTANLQDARVHDLRHTYASHLVSSGVPLAVVGKLLGHTQSATTERYSHLAESPLREATGRMGKLFSRRA